MKSIIKTLLFGLFLFVMVGMKAQDDKAVKYETAMVWINQKNIEIIRPNTPTETIPVSSYGNFSKTSQDFINVVQSLVDKGWTIINFDFANESGTAGRCFLKRKKQ